ncbi:MAG: stage 0 sporulation protein [Kiritimatiellae bacterium]|nr:stage 0 sporulation protein [Kiritimatiellia bacterium]
MFRLLHVDFGDGAPVEAYSLAELAIHEGDPCVLDVGNMLEFGDVSRIGRSLDELPKGEKLPQVLRRATLQDQAKAKENALVGRLAWKTSEEKIKALELEMCLVRVHYSFDRKKLTVSFTAEERVDFRELVKRLAEELGVRVEMRQIGPRDAAAIVGGFGPCGRIMCCCAWLKKFTPVTIRMAKDQGVPLNPNTLNGMCGRLKCCLRFEHGCYKELDRRVPACGALVDCSAGRGHVVDRNVLMQRVRVRLADSRVLDLDAEDVVVAKSAPDRRPRGGRRPGQGGREDDRGSRSAERGARMEERGSG